jgi:ribonuclease-3
VGSAAALAARLGLTFRDLSLLSEALVHSSYPNEHPELELRSNERLEFLGDAVVSLVFSEAFFRRQPSDDEGLLTARRASIVSTRGLSRLAQRIDLGDELLLGQGADRANERQRDSILAAGLEAVVGAIYLELGLDTARDWLLAVAAPELAAEPPLVSLKSPKSRLQEQAYARTGRAPVYRVLSAAGPDHDKTYVVEALVGGVVVGRGQGGNRRDAETEAAAAALDLLMPAAAAASGDAVTSAPPPLRPSPEARKGGPRVRPVSPAGRERT